jgi:tetratricopeptide (TPR) repeat protein
MSLRTIICLSVVVVLATIPLSAQNVSSRRLSRAVVDPVELSGPPKKPIILSPAKRAFAQSAAMNHLQSKDPSVLATTLHEITSFIQQDPTDTDFFIMRALVSCEIAGSNKEAILKDIDTSVKLWKPNENSAFDSLRDHYTQKAKVDFLLGRYVDALDQLDAGMRIDYVSASRMFSINGNVKADQPTAVPCMWSLADVNKLAELFPTDYRTSLYVGLYKLAFSHYSLDTDYQPILKAFEHAAELNPSSAVASYFNAYPYVYGNIGGLISQANAKCLDDVVPRTEPCLELDEIHRTGVRYLTKAIAADPTFEPAYVERAGAHRQLRENRQAIRDYTKALDLDPKANLYQDRASAESELKEYQAAILDYTKSIARGCEDTLCGAYEYRADVYLRLHDYPHAISDLGHAIRNYLAGTIFGFNIDQFRRIYPEYDAIADDVLCEKLRVLFNPQISYADYSKQLLVNANDLDVTVLPELFLKRGDAYADMGDFASANREYDRVSAGFPKWAVHAFTMRNGKRIRVRS